MINLNLNIINYTKQILPSFKGYEGSTTITKSDNQDINVYNKTAFMRDFETLKFTRDYLIKNFPNGTNIAEFGCSLGQKPYSLMILLDKYNNNKKYKITGYDFPEVLAKMRIPIYSIDKHSLGEEILLDNFQGSESITKNEAKELRETFFKYMPVYRIDDFSTLQEKRHYARLKKNADIIVRPDIKQTKDIIKFEPGDILDIDNIIKSKNTGAVIFQNALYHILGVFYTHQYPTSVSLEKAFTLFKKVNKVLPQNGIFVIGNLPSDHTYSDFELPYCHEKYINNKLKKVYDSSKIHNMLYASGFEPIFYEKIPDGTIYLKDTDIYLPSVWKKVKNV